MTDWLHVVPVNDLILHDIDSDDCVCGPSVEFCDGGAVVVHHSLDGREAKERFLQALREVEDS